MVHIFNELPGARITGPQRPGIRCIQFNSRKVEKGDLFVAVRGTQVDGHAYIADAVAQGASAIVCETLPEGDLEPEVSYVLVEDSALALALLAAAYYGHPSEKLRLVGVTGTNGKTTVATLLYDLFTAMGHKCGLISTVVYRVGDERIESTHTTPDPLTLNRLMADMAEAGCDYCFMEVSSHSIVQERIKGLRFTGGIFTNITHDHLDYHKTFAEYIKAKQAFFTYLPKEAFALTNVDDKNGEVMLQNSVARRKATYSLRNVADYHGRIVEEHLDGMQIDMNRQELWVQFIGRFNAYNLTAIYGAAMELGQDSAEVLRVMSTLRPVSGRFEQIRAADGRLAIVDYAHTPDALQNVIDTINELRKEESRLITVVGCGGNRDVTKRPVMARVAADGSSRVILTSDNPRFEEPQAILDEMRGGLDAGQLGKTLTISDRREAIRTAAALARPGDIVLVAGKGHEPYQEVAGVRHHFDDREEVTAAFS